MPFRTALFHRLLVVLCVAQAVLAAQIAVPLQRLRPSRPLQIGVDDVPLKQPRVFWRSGEFIDGQLTAASDRSLSVKSDIFVDPVELQTGVLDRVEFPAPSDNAVVPGAFSILLKNGDRLFADITAVTAAGVVLKNDRHGELTMPLAMVQSVQRLKGGSVLYAGPTGVAGWKHYGLRDAQGFPWTAGPRGSLVTRVWNRVAMVEMELPESVEVAVVLSSTGALRFGLSLAQGTGSAQVPAVETWQDDLVIAQDERFEPVLKLSDEDRSLALRLFMNRASGRMVVCDWSGRQLVEFASKPVTTSKPAILIKNKGANLTVEQLIVRSWDGSTITPRDVKQPLVELMDAAPMQGTLQHSLDGKGLMVGATMIPIDRLLSFDAGPEPADVAKLDALKKPLAQMLVTQAVKPPASIRYADGTTLSGSIVGLAGEALQLKSTLTAQPLMARLQGISRVLFGGDAAVLVDLDKLDLLQIGSTMLHGTLEGTGDSKLRWRLPGAVQPAAVAKRADIEVRRPARSDVQQSPTLFFLKDGNVLGAKLLSVSDEEVRMQSDVAEVDKLEPTQLNAIHFNSRKVESSGFGDPAWQILKGTDREVQRRGTDKVLLAGAGAWAHPSVMAGDEVSFTMGMPNYWAALAVSLFAGDLEHRTKSAELHLIYSGSDFWAVLESGENNSRSSEQLRNLTTKNIDVRMLFGENSVTIYANDMPLMNAVLDESSRKGSGIIFSPSAMWGNPTRDVEISNFKVTARPDFVRVPAVTEESRRHALTIPRFRRANVPTHVLLAPNGDVLRGRIESASTSLIKFHSGLDHIDVPTDRVAAAVWLDKPKEAAKPTSADAKPGGMAPQADPTVIENFAKDMASHWLVLQDGSRLAVKIDRFEKDHIKAWAPTLGEVKIPSSMLSVLKTSVMSPSGAMIAYQGWKPEFAAEPVLPETGGQSSPLLNKPAPDFALPLLGGAQFNLGAQKGKVVVLDFWATWCGPCVASMPEQLKTMESFDPNQVKFVAVNQAEPEAVVSRFLQARGWKMAVAMDSQQAIAQKYGMESIPYCVVVGPDGNVIWVTSGYTPGSSEKMAGVIRKALGVQ